MLDRVWEEAEMPDVSSSSERTLAAKVDHLFRTVRPHSGKEYSFEEVAETIRSGGGPTISATYLWQLRKGLRDNPTRRHLEALAGFFGVPPAYFFDATTTSQVDAELALLAALRDASVRQIALRASGLSAKSLGAITEMVERAREIEGLPDERDKAES
ncbi:helix-turn-helix domain-containing protein [Actinosynnema sp. ALI-1.44]|uniref:helix-turn-helix domain-containing protein n=1 Tax=Actinosynnema sp. ALI-1.44 TaxID=1933779 RepID=UPI001EDB2CC8|nr:helix-turn-helix domain-containing protein [Actinosynnema sp. ALI-1.44]